MSFSGIEERNSCVRSCRIQKCLASNAHDQSLKARQKVLPSLMMVTHINLSLASLASAIFLVTIANDYTKDADSSSDDDVGPMLPSAAPPKKKRRILPHEALYVAALPKGTRYSKSLMHKDQLAFVAFTPRTDFLITASIDGQVSFWKKTSGGETVEFVKQFKAHTDEIRSTSTSWDGRSFASCARDGTVKVWDVVTFDLVAVLNVKSSPSCVCWVHGRARGGVPMLAVGNDVNGDIDIYDGRGESQDPLFTVKSLHRKPVHCLAYNAHWDCVVSADESGMIEYWKPDQSAEKPEGIFSVKSATDLFDFKKVSLLVSIYVLGNS